MKHLNSILPTLAFGAMGVMSSVGYAAEAPAAKGSSAPTAKTAAEHATKPVDAAAKAVDNATSKTAEGATATKAEATKTKRKVVAKAKAAAEGGEEGMAIGSSKQEPKPGPYSAEVEADFAYATISGTTKQGDSGSIKNSGSSINFSTTYQFIFGHFSAGPKLSYTNTTSKQTSAATDVVSSSTTTTTSSATGFGAAAQYFIFDINTEKMVPYIGLSYVLQSGSSSTKTDGTDTTTKNSTSGNEMVLSAGVEYFLSRHVSVKPGLAYQMTSTTTKNPDQDNSTLKTDTNTIGIVAGLAVLL